MRIPPAAIRTPARRSRGAATRPRSWWLLAAVSLVVMGGFSAPYVTLDPAQSRVPVADGGIEYPALVAHIALAFLALAAGFAQFSSRLRHRAPRVHRLVGRVYVMAVMCGGVLAFVLIGHVGSFTQALAFFTLTVVWLASTGIAFVQARRHRFASHGLWMARSFSITLVAVSARLLVPFLLLGYAAFNGFALPGGREQMVQDVLEVNIWVGLVVDLVVLEWILRRRGAPTNPPAAAGAGT